MLADKIVINLLSAKLVIVSIKALHHFDVWSIFNLIVLIKINSDF